MKPLSKNVILPLVAVLVVVAVFSSITLRPEKPEDITVGTLVERIQKNEIARILTKEVSKK